MIERAYRLGETLGVTVWTQDEAGPYRTQPYAGQSWQPQGEPSKHAHEYFPNGTAKIMTLFHPSDGNVRVQGVEATPNRVLHPWLKENLSEIVAALPPTVTTKVDERNRAIWERWRQNLTVKFLCTGQKLERFSRKGFHGLNT